MDIDPNRPATEKQVDYCKFLFRKIKIYYQCLTDMELVHEVQTRTGYNLNALTHGDVQKIVAMLKPKTEDRVVYGKWGKRYLR